MSTTRFPSGMAGLEYMKRPLGRRALIASGPLHDMMTLPIGKSNIVRVVQAGGVGIDADNLRWNCMERTNEKKHAKDDRRALCSSGVMHYCLNIAVLGPA